MLRGGGPEVRLRGSGLAGSEWAEPNDDIYRTSTGHYRTLTGHTGQPDTQGSNARLQARSGPARGGAGFSGSSSGQGSPVARENSPFFRGRDRGRSSPQISSTAPGRGAVPEKFLPFYDPQNAILPVVFHALTLLYS